jgi:O-antigen/teichoic acid export membrane protein
VLLKDGGQIVLGRMTSAVFNRFDWIFLGSLKAAATVGVYSIAYRMFEFCSRVPGLMALSIFPVLCEGEQQDRDVREQVLLAMKLALLPGCVVTVFAFCWAEPAIVLLLGPDYRGAGLLLFILSLSLPFRGVGHVLYHLTIARRRQRYLVWASGATAVGNIVLCLLLIPPYGAHGAALAMVGPSILQFWLLGLAAQQTTDLARSLWYGLRVTVITAVPAVLLWATQMPWYAAICPAAIVTAVALWFWSGFTADEKRMIRRVWRRVALRLARR